MKARILGALLVAVLVPFLSASAEAKQCKAGDKAKVLWNGYYYQATLKAKKGDKYCVSYDGWAKSWDECVAPSRFTCTKGMAFKAGQKVEVEWKSTYYPAKIKSLKGGKYCITYIGWESSWDECVGPKRVRKK